MLSVNPYIRITKVFNSNMYMLNCPTNASICREIGKTYLELLLEVNSETGIEKEKIEKRYSKNLIGDLLEEGTLLETDSPQYNCNILEKCNHKYPLTGIVIELTNACNLNCIHCYGQFGRSKDYRMWTLAEVKDLKSRLDDVEVLIETAVSKINISNVVAVREFVKKEYPKFERKTFFISPTENTEISFSGLEIKNMSSEYEFLLKNYFKRHNVRRFLCFGRKRRRCYGGVVNGVITADRKVKCCPLAQDEDFVMGNVSERDLVSIWDMPDNETEKFRNEFIRNSVKCKKCMYRRKCGDANYRVEAKTLTGDWKNNRPYICSAIEHREGK